MILQISMTDKYTDNTIKTSLKQHHLFSRLTSLQLGRVIRYSKIQHLDESATLFNQGETVAGFYMVLSGKMKLFRISPDGQEKIIEIIKTGEVFAEALMFTDQTDYPVSAAALAETEVLKIDAKKFKHMLWDSPDTCFLLLGAMSVRLRGLVEEIDTLTLHSGTCRVATYLIHEMPENTDRFELDTAKNVIAARLSIKPETFSRIIKNLKNEGVLTIEGNTVCIYDIAGLKEHSII